MATTRSPEEVLHDYQAMMGPDLGAAFCRLWNDCGWLHLKWREYRIVFGTSQARLDLLNAAAGGFFFVVDDTLWNDVLLQICRFTDPPIVSGRETLSLRGLLGLIDEPHRPPVLDLIKVAEARAEFARDRRHRSLAHRDRQLALKPAVKPLAPASRQHVQDAIDAVTAVLVHIETVYTEAPTAFEYLSQLGDGEALLRVLRDGIEARDQALRRLETGEGDATFFTRPLD